MKKDILMTRAKTPLNLPAFHARIIAEMNAIHNNLKGRRPRALRAMQEISTTSVPHKHVDDVRDAMTGMLERLGGANSRYFTRGNRVVINRAAAALAQQEQAGSNQQTEHRTSGDTGGEHPAYGADMPRAIPRHVPSEAAA